MAHFFKELYIFLRDNKWWWIIPLVIFLALLGLLIYFSRNTHTIPVFVYNIPG